MFIGIISIISIVLWITVSIELQKTSKERNERKLIILMSAGSLSTAILTISLLLNHQF